MSVIPSPINAPESSKLIDWKTQHKTGNDTSDTKSNSSESKLHDIEEQLGITENRCNTLKEQLNYMKKCCIDVKKYEKRSESKSDKFKRATYTIINDHTDPNVRTINNILTGLSNSVNRLSALHSDIDSKQGGMYEAKKEVREIACGHDVVVTINNHQNGANVEDRLHKISDGQENNAVDRSNANICVVQNNKKRLRSKQRKVNKTTSSHFPKSSREKNYNFDKASSSGTTTHKRVKVIKRFNKFKIQTKPIISEYPSRIVELYHNNKAVNKSDSDDSCQKNNKQQQEEFHLTTDLQLSNQNTIINYDNMQQNSITKMDYYPHYQQSLNTEMPQLKKQLSRIAENDTFDNTVSCTFMKNYELPTIASKLKQVAKGYMPNFDFRTIPFCAARSTTPSHNIGINIQQIMSIMKTRQPLNGISPTLAHNIGVAAEKLQNNPLSAIVSTLGSRLGMRYGRSQCPLTRYHSYNYHQLQDMAREIPEEPCMADSENDGNNCQRSGPVNYSGACGDNDVQQYNSVWTVDPRNQRNCTCVQNNGVAFDQVYNKYASTPGTRSTYSVNYGKGRDSRMQRFKRWRNPFRFNKNNIESNSNQPLRGKEKTLKEVLENLHTEFEQMNIKYETLNKQVNLGIVDKSKEVIQELEKLESDLTKKENEINMVMDLYKEVTTLKEQVKTLKEKASTGSIVTSAHVPTTQIRRDREQNTVVHLTKLLRQIQQYQGLYK